MVTPVRHKVLLQCHLWWWSMVDVWEDPSMIRWGRNSFWDLKSSEIWRKHLRPSDTQGHEASYPGDVARSSGRRAAREFWEEFFGGWLKVIGENTWFFLGVSWWKHLFLLGVECWLFRLKKWFFMIFEITVLVGWFFVNFGRCRILTWRYQNDATLSPG